MAEELRKHSFGLVCFLKLFMEAQFSENGYSLFINYNNQVFGCFPEFFGIGDL